MEIIEMDTIAGKMFTKNPNPPKSFQLSFDTYNLKELFEALLTLFVEGLKILYGDKNNKVNMFNLNEDDLKLLKKCMLSAGLELYVEIYAKDDWLKNHINNFKSYDEIIITNNTKLSDLKVAFLNDHFSYKICFNNLI